MSKVYENRLKKLENITEFYHCPYCGDIIYSLHKYKRHLKQGCNLNGQISMFENEVCCVDILEHK